MDDYENGNPYSDADAAMVALREEAVRKLLASSLCPGTAAGLQTDGCQRRPRANATRR